MINHTAQARSIRLGPQDRDDLCASGLLAILKGDFALLRNFRGQSSLATYLTVVSRRIVVRELLHRKSIARLAPAGAENAEGVSDPQTSHEQRVSDQDEVERLLGGLQGTEAQVVRLFHLEGKVIKRSAPRSGCRRTALARFSVAPRQVAVRRGDEPGPVDGCLSAKAPAFYFFSDVVGVEEIAVADVEPAAANHRIRPT